MRKRNLLSPNIALDVVCSLAGTTIGELGLSRRWDPRFSHVRRIAYAVLHCASDLSKAEIGLLVQTEGQESDERDVREDLQEVGLALSGRSGRVWGSLGASEPEEPLYDLWWRVGSALEGRGFRVDCRLLPGWRDRA